MYNGSNFSLWKMQLRFIFQSHDMYYIVNGTLQKSSLTNLAEQILWEKKDKHAIVAVLGTLDSFHKQEVINCSTPHTMWTQLQASLSRTINTPKSASLVCKRSTIVASSMRESLLLCTLVLCSSQPRRKLILAKQSPNNDSLARSYVVYLLHLIRCYLNRTMFLSAIKPFSVFNPDLSSSKRNYEIVHNSQMRPMRKPSSPKALPLTLPVLAPLRLQNKRRSVFKSLPDISSMHVVINVASMATLEKTVLTTLIVLQLLILQNASTLRVLPSIISTSNHIRAKKAMAP